MDHIVALDDDALRNLWITWSYHALSAALARRSGPVANWFRRPDPVDAALDALVALLRARVRGALTEHLMTLDLPEVGVLRLGRGLEASAAASLERLEDPELLALLARFAPTTDGSPRTGGNDWADLGQRMRFIAALFRAHHETLALHGAPFSPDQVASMLEGRRPTGRL